MKCFVFVFIININQRLTIIPSNYFKWPMFNILLNRTIGDFSTNQSLRIKNRICCVERRLIFRGFTNKSFSICESYIRWHCPISLVVCNNFNISILPNTYGAICSSQINTDCLIHYDNKIIVVFSLIYFHIFIIGKKHLLSAKTFIISKNIYY